MSRSGWGLIAAGMIAAVMAAALLLARAGERTSQDRPRLLLLTSLPLMFAEGFSIDAKSAPIVDALRERYDVVSVDTTAPAALAKGRLLMMAQPRAQTADNLVALDRWVREGGRVLLFADPKLDWPSELPLGDANRPPPMFADTGLLGHWGLRLDAPDHPGAAAGQIAGAKVQLSSRGTLVKTGGECELDDSGRVAECRLGKGRATIVADADMLDVERFGEANGAATIALLDSLRR